jgi:hypothetical protein
MEYRISASATVNAVAPTVYAIIADYRDGHRRIVPPKYFTWLQVEDGATGAGTRIRFSMRVLGTSHELRAVITEPEPGRVLVETYPDTGNVTTFTVEPAGNGSTRVTIDTVMRTRGGVAGFIEQFLLTRLLRTAYQQELNRLADIAEGRREHAPIPANPGT